MSPSEYVKKIWNQYESLGKQEKSINGRVFEYVLASLLMNQQIAPFYLQAKIAFVPNVEYDLLLYGRRNKSEKFRPFTLSAKTSLRERYKQADLEAIALKNVHRKAEAYLLTLSAREAAVVKGKIREGDISGLDDVIYCFDKEFDDFILQKIKQLELTTAGEVRLISAETLVEP